MILFLNKRDLFAQKIRKSDIRNDGSDGAAPRFLDYTGGTCRCPPDVGEACVCGAQAAAKTYILNLFKSKYTEPGKQVPCVCVCVCGRCVCPISSSSPPTPSP